MFYANRESGSKRKPYENETFNLARCVTGGNNRNTAGFLAYSHVLFFILYTVLDRLCFFFGSYYINELTPFVFKRGFELISQRSRLIEVIYKRIIFIPISIYRFGQNGDST